MENPAMDSPPTLRPKLIKNFHLEEASKMTYSDFGRTGMKVSKLSFGGSQLAYVYNTPKESEGIRVVKEAIQSGMNYIDTAPWYGFGTAEIVLGKALRDIPRSAYYLATKVGRYKPDYLNMFDFSASRTLASVDESLQKLGVDYLDVIQIHDLEFAENIDIILNETLPALQKVKDSGKARFIGITGYPLKTLKEVLDRSPVHIDVVLSYCRCSLWDQSLHDYIPYFEEKGIAVVNAAILGMNLLTNHDLPLWHPATEEIKAACSNAVQFCKDKDCDISRLAISHALAQPKIQTHLVGINDMEHLKKNLSSIVAPLTRLEEEVLQTLLNKFFRPLAVTHWEETELVKYRKKLLLEQSQIKK